MLGQTAMGVEPTESRWGIGCGGRVGRVRRDWRGAGEREALLRARLLMDGLKQPHTHVAAGRINESRVLLNA